VQHPHHGQPTRQRSAFFLIPNHFGVNIDLYFAVEGGLVPRTGESADVADSAVAGRNAFRGAPPAEGGVGRLGVPRHGAHQSLQQGFQQPAEHENRRMPQTLFAGARNLFHALPPGINTLYTYLLVFFM
jgi:hypothetical protein